MLSGVPGMLGEYFKKKQEIEELKLQNQLAIQLEQQKQIGQLAEQDSQRAALTIGATSAKFKYIVFAVLSYPFMLALFGHAEYAARIFNQLAMLPQWYLVLFTSIVAVVWGIPVQGNIMNMVVEGVKGAVANRRDYALQKLDKKAYYEALRQVKGSVTDADVQLQDKVLDKLEGK
jgi:hypothetical protein